MPWTKFRNLCHYYVDCLRYSSKSQEVLFPDQLNKTMLMPSLPINWFQKKSFNIDFNAQQQWAANTLLANADDGEIFIGYPLHTFVATATRNTCVSPILLFPAKLTSGPAGAYRTLKIEIDYQGISFNQGWLDFHIPKTNQIQFKRVLKRATKPDGTVDIDTLFSFLHAHYNTGIDPNGFEMALQNKRKDGLVNTPLLFAETKPKYTKTLLRELRQIAKEPDAVLDQTALAYIFREPRLPNEPIASQTRMPVSFTERNLNRGQVEAVKSALNTPVTVVKGPPGTGKSFMSVNLIANEVLAGGRVLFTSKNHKAIHAIYGNANATIRNSEFPLVTFCTTDDNNQNADWTNLQKAVDARVARVSLAQKQGLVFDGDKIFAQLASINTNNLDVALSKYRDAEGYITRYQVLRDYLSQHEQLAVDLETQISRFKTVDLSNGNVRHLLEQADALLAQPMKRSLWQRLIRALHIRLKGKRAREDVLAQLKAVAPTLFSVFATRETHHKTVRELLKLANFKTAVSGWIEQEMERLHLLESEYQYDALKEEVKTSMANAKAVSQKVYAEQLMARISQIRETDTLVKTCVSEAKAVEDSRLPFTMSHGDANRYDKLKECFSDLLTIFPAWACTMLSLKRAAPCAPALFSLAIIDEASQCEVPPMIPVLFRAQRVAIVGDPEQFPPVIDLTEARDQLLQQRYAMDAQEYTHYVYTENNVFSVARFEPLWLNEHFRCADGIASYINEIYYDGKLTLGCDVGRENGSSPIGITNPGMMWVDANGGDESEMETALDYLKGLKKQGYAGSIGVISPLRKVVNAFQEKVNSAKQLLPQNIKINTANGFQGAECDVIIFLLGLNKDRKQGETWYITAEDNKYIYNVSVSRARHLFYGIGDSERVKNSGINYIQKLIPTPRSQRNVHIGPGEECLKVALQRVGIQTEAQYPVQNRFLDLAIPSLKIDIEVDGQAYHLDQNGCRKADDILRDCQLEAANWKVVRVWHNDVINKIDECIQKVREAIQTQMELLSNNPKNN